MIEAGLREQPGRDGLILGSHGLFTWGATQRDCYLNSITTIDQMGQFIDRHRARHQIAIRRARARARSRTAATLAARMLPALRGDMSSNRRVIAHFADDEVSLEFAGSRWSKELSRLGTSCPDHFLRTRICPLVVDWSPASDDIESLKAAIRKQVVSYRDELHEILRVARHVRLAEAARLEPVGRHHSGHRAFRLRQDARRKRASRRSFSSTPST